MTTMQLDEVKPMLKEIGLKLQLLHVFTITDVHRTPFDVAVLKAIVSSFKMREDSETEAEQNMLRMKELSTLSPGVPLHHNARRERGGNPMYLGKRIAVSDKQVPWSFAWLDYKPNEFTAPVVIQNSALLSTSQKWADPAELHGPAVKEGFSDLRAEVRGRTTYIGGPQGAKLATAIRFDAADGMPLNPRGRTGLCGRGLLGKWGPNHAADPIVTRWNPEEPRQLQMVAIKRNDTGAWAIPGGMVDEGEMVSATLKREFTEEAGGHLEQSSKARFDELAAELFKNGELVYCGCERWHSNLRPAAFAARLILCLLRAWSDVDDPRNTDNAWMETTANHFHCGRELGALLPLKAGDDAGQVTWLDINVKEPRYGPPALPLPPRVCQCPATATRDPP